MKYWKEVNGQNRIISATKEKIRDMMKEEAKKYRTTTEYYRSNSALHWVEIKASEIVGYDVVEL